MRQLWHPELDQVSLARVLTALGDPVRLAIIRTLADGEEHTRSDFDSNELAQSTLSHHVKMLREAGLTRTRWESVRCFLSLRPEFEDRFPGLLTAILDQAADPPAGPPVSASRPPLPRPVR
jgi:DNA-binding transcriptional ArsR family regulator